MPNNGLPKLLFVINPVSGGKEKINWAEGIQDYYKNLHHHFEICTLTGKDDSALLKNKISALSPSKVIAVGGDGTVKMVAEQLLHTNIALGILPAGSANGMATELNIPKNLKEALDVINSDHSKKISVIMLNEKDISIHLSDIGLNALLIKYFEEGERRGMWGYAKVMFRVLRTKRLMQIEMELDEQKILRAAYMIVVANARAYGTGAVINPEGSLYDEKMEVIVVRKLPLLELLKMLVTHTPFNTECIEVFHTGRVKIITKRKNHFQVDGEYRGKTDTVNAKLIPAALNVLLPSEK